MSGLFGWIVRFSKIQQLPGILETSLSFVLVSKNFVILDWMGSALWLRPSKKSFVLFIQYLSLSQPLRDLHNALRALKNIAARFDRLAILSQNSWGRLVRKSTFGSGRIPFDQKFRNFRRGQMVREFPGKSFRKCGNKGELLNFGKANHIPEFSGWKSNGMEISTKIVRKFGYTSRGFPLFRKLCKFVILGPV